MNVYSYVNSAFRINHEKIIIKTRNWHGNLILVEVKNDIINIYSFLKVCAFYFYFVDWKHTHVKFKITIVICLDN